ncbi:MAG: PadR family transcriptional regulator [Anaerolineae bacterium]|nr:PadR family transcriptional regulator [Anaerolineae bacterium]
MSLKHTLLGLLVLHPRTGYDLYKRMEQTTFLLESASLRRIYPTLKQMSEQELVTFEIQPQEGKPDRKVYSVTDKGEAEFLAWLREPPEQDNFSMERLFGKFFFYGILDNETIIAHLQSALERRKKIRKKMDAFRFDPPAGPCRPIVDSDRVMMTWDAMLDYGRADLETQIQWLKDTIKHIEDSAEKTLSPQSRKERKENKASSITINI